MISETRFAKRYNSLWRSIAPTMELFIRKCNLSLYERNWPELVSQSPPSARALINRTAFELFQRTHSASTTISTMLKFVKDPTNVSEAEIAANLVEILDRSAKVEVSELARRMWLRFHQLHHVDLVINPVFKGCGIINTCSGDVLEPDAHLVEFKDGDRAFRSYEFRQLSLYAALFLNETGQAPASIEVLNSRRGVSVCVSMDKFADEVAGQSAVDFLREIIRVITDESFSG